MSERERETDRQTDRQTDRETLDDESIIKICFVQKKALPNSKIALF